MSFDGLVFGLIDNEARELAGRIQEAGGVVHSAIPQVPESSKSDWSGITHVIASSIDFPEFAEVDRLGLLLVKPSWVVNCLEQDRLVASALHSPCPTKNFFNGIKATCSELPSSDRAAIAGGIVAFGGQYSDALLRTTTHIVTLNLENVWMNVSKYEINS